MAINTYDDLKLAIQTWLNRKDSLTVGQIETFINFAEQDIRRLVKYPQDESVQKTTIDMINFFTVILPEDYKEAKHVTVNNRPYNRVDYETFTRLKTDGVEKTVVVTGDPLTRGEYFFARRGNELVFIPELVENDVVELIYWQNVPPMQNGTDTCATLSMAPDLMVYLALRHAAIFLRDNEQAQFWEQKASDAGLRLLQQLDDIEWSGSALVVPTFKL